MFQIVEKEKQYLRELAKRQKEYANRPEMEEKKKNWYDLNMGKATIPPIVVETETFANDMMPEGILQCQTKEARTMEYRLLKNIREYELIHDDKVIPDTYSVEYKVKIDEFGIPVEECHAQDANGRSVGYQYNSPIQDLEEDFSMLRPASMEVDWEETEKEKKFAEEVLGDILPIEMRGIPPIIAMPWQVSKLLGLEGMMISLYDCPDAVHALMQYLTKNQIQIMKKYEFEGILTFNNGNHETGMSSFGFTKELPREHGKEVRLHDLWLWAEAEETAAISPEMFQEFFLPYMAEACKEIGQIYYGCCEPMEKNWPMLIKEIPNIRKVSVSPFSDQRQMGEMLRGTPIVFSRKPLANYLSIDNTFDEDGWKSHIQETLDAAKGCQCEIIMRDIYQVSSLDKVKRAIEIAKQQAENF